MYVHGFLEVTQAQKSLPDLPEYPVCTSPHALTELPSASLQVDEQLYRLQFERADLLKRIDEDQEDLNGLMQKHKDLIAQVRTLSQLVNLVDLTGQR